jgi:hypothetical protein
MALINIHIHPTVNEDKLDVILKKLNHAHSHLDYIIKQQLQMATKAEFQQALADVTSALDNIAADITRLTDQLATGNLSDADEQEVFDQLRAVADRARTIADTTVDPETPPTPEEPA